MTIKCSNCGKPIRDSKEDEMDFCSASCEDEYSFDSEWELG